MKYREFIDRVKTYSDFSDAEAEQATQAFMETLAGHLNDEEMAEFTVHLPLQLAEMASAGIVKTERLRGDEFLERIASDQGIEESVAEEQIYAVWQALKETLDRSQIQHLASRLPNELVDMLG